MQSQAKISTTRNVCSTTMVGLSRSNWTYLVPEVNGRRSWEKYEARSRKATTIATIESSLVLRRPASTCSMNISWASTNLRPGESSSSLTSTVRTRIQTRIFRHISLQLCSSAMPTSEIA